VGRGGRARVVLSLVLLELHLHLRHLGRGDVAFADLAENGESGTENHQ
jgi:hypothetical protein